MHMKASGFYLLGSVGRSPIFLPEPASNRFNDTRKQWQKCKNPNHPMDHLAYYVGPYDLEGKNYLPSLSTIFNMTTPWEGTFAV